MQMTNGAVCPGIFQLLPYSFDHTVAGTSDFSKHRITHQERGLSNDPCSFYGSNASFLIREQLVTDRQNSLQRLAEYSHSPTVYTQPPNIPKYEDVNNHYIPVESPYGSPISAVDRSPTPLIDHAQDISSISSLNNTYSFDYLHTDQTPGFSVSNPSSDKTGSFSSPASYTSTANKRKTSSSDGDKKTRTKYSVEQTNRLERLFLENRYPDPDAVEKIATDIVVAEGKIRIWFQNKRARCRRQATTRKQHIPSNMAAPPANFFGMAPRTDIHHHISSSKKNDGSSYDCGFENTEPEADSQLQQAIANLMYSCDERVSHPLRSHYHTDERVSLPVTSPYHAVTSLYQRIASSPYSYTPIC